MLQDLLVTSRKVRESHISAPCSAGKFPFRETWAEPSESLALVDENHRGVLPRVVMDLGERLPIRRDFVFRAADHFPLALRGDLQCARIETLARVRQILVRP